MTVASNTFETVNKVEITIPSYVRSCVCVVLNMRVDVCVFPNKMNDQKMTSNVHVMTGTVYTKQNILIKPFHSIHNTVTCYSILYGTYE